jgi:hypothetical protein
MAAEDHEAYRLLEEGEQALKDGSPEAQIFKLVKDDGSTKDEIEQLAGALAKVGLSQCMQAKWLKIDKDKGGKIFKEVASITDAVQDQLKLVQGGKLPPKADVDKLKKRKMIADAKYKTYKVGKGPEYAPVTLTYPHTNTHTHTHTHTYPPTPPPTRIYIYIYICIYIE